jgi:cell wall-associated NlpC family hydrolase
MVLSYAFCNVSVAPVHRDPAHRSEQTSQLLFGEKLEVLEIEGHDWARIRGRWDGYEGWCKASQLQFIQPKEYRKPIRHLTDHHGQILFEEGAQWLPAGSELTGLKHSKLAFGDRQGKYKGRKLAAGKLECTPQAAVAAARSYLHAPYQWGGRTVAGIDCSGLVQMAFKLCGHAILRDASLQATEGRTVDFLTEGRAGDLAFFDNEDGRITHVGMLLDHQTIIHATDTTGRVVIDRLDNGGIISIMLRRRTHNLRLIRRILPEGS